MDLKILDENWEIWINQKFLNEFDNFGFSGKREKP